MKKTEFVQIKGLDTKELLLKVKDLKGEIESLVLDKNMKKLKDLKSISKKRKDLAQVSTVLRQKELLAKLESSQKELVTDNVTEKPKVRKGARTEVSK